jgi:hypothetical protein
MTFTLVAFLVLHGLLHAAIWLPHPTPDPDRPPPFLPDHSGVLTVAAVRQDTAHRLAVGLAIATTVTYVLAATAVAVAADGAVSVAVGAAVLGLALKFVFFHPWLTLGVLLDLLVLSSVLLEWPVALT